MALGKLWNALFGKRSETDTNPTTREVAQRVETAPRVEAAPAATPDRPVLKVKRKALAAKAKKSTSVPVLAVANTVEPTHVETKRIAHPKKNGWSKFVAGREITSILDTNIGDASRGVELLEAIVCDLAPTPKYIAIAPFDLTSGGLTLVQFHQRVRRAGGQAVPIPGTIDAGLRHLSRTLGTVDLILLDDVTQPSEETQRLLDRVTHVNTLVLRRDEKNQWSIAKQPALATHHQDSTSRGSQKRKAA